LLAIEITNSKNKSKIDKIGLQIECRGDSELYNVCKRTSRKGVSIPKSTPKIKSGHINSEFIEKPSMNLFDPTEKVEPGESSDSLSQSKSSEKFIKEGIGKRQDVVSKTLIRSLKRFYAGKLCPTRKKLFNFDSREVQQTLVNIDRVSY
jgi:hypothetical protein